jgi:O-antigen/teichoic acid export membrane protein
MAVLPQVAPRRLWVNSAAIFGGEAASRLATLLMAIVIAHHFGATALGQYGYALALTSILLLVPDFGLHLYMVRELSADRAGLRAVFWNVHWLKFILVGAVLLFSLWFGLWGEKDSGRRVLFCILAGRALLQTFSQACMAVFKAYEEMHYVAWQQMLNTALVAVWVAGSLAFHASLPVVVLGFIVGQAAETGMGWQIVRARFWPGPPLKWKSAMIAATLAAAVPIGVTAILQAVNLRVDMLVLSHFAADGSLGQFQAAAWFPVGAFLGASLLMTVLFPKITRLLQRDSPQARDYVLSLLKNGVLVTSLGGLAVWLTAPYLLVTFFGRDAAPAIGTLRILAPMLPLMFLNTVLFYVFVAAGRRRVYLGTLALGVAAGLILSVSLTSAYGPTGCAFADVARESIISASFLYFLAHETQTRTAGLAMAKVFTGSTMLAGAGLFLAMRTHMGEPWIAAWMILVFMGTLAALGLPRRREWALLMDDSL